MDFNAVDMASAFVSKAQSATSLKAATSVTKMAMDSANVEAKAINEMLPDVPPPGKGQYINRLV